MSTDPTPQASLPRVIIRYPNLSGALVLVHEHPPFGNAYDHPRPLYDAECTGCLDRKSDQPDTALWTTRRWADAHSAACRALPQPETDDRTGGTQ